MLHEFNPTEIIFASTTLCNLHCAHCFVNRTSLKLNIDDAKSLILSCKQSESSQIDKIGFSGGEPFLYLDFLTEIIKFSREQDFMFDQIMTNGDWWKDEANLRKTLQKIYDAGYDGKIGVSYDNFHAQKFERIQTFCSVVNEIFGEENLAIQAVADPFLDEQKSNQLESELNSLCDDFAADIFILPQTFQADDERGWQSKKWFKEDFCSGPGNIFFVHPTGDIAPCCGFANEDKQLFIGKITDSFEKIMQNARENKMVQTCFSSGLLKRAKEMEKSGAKFPGKGRTSDICTFCDFVCKSKFKI